MAQNQKVKTVGEKAGDEGKAGIPSLRRISGWLKVKAKGGGKGKVDWKNKVPNLLLPAWPLVMFMTLVGKHLRVRFCIGEG